MLGKVIKAKRQAEAKIVVAIADAILVQMLHRVTPPAEVSNLKSKKKKEQNNHIGKFLIWVENMLQCSFPFKAFQNHATYLILLNHYRCPIPVKGGHLCDKIFSFGKCNCQK